MEIIFSKKEGILEFFKETAKMKKSDISDNCVDVFVGAERIYFYPKSADIAAFSLSKEEMDRLFWSQLKAFTKEHLEEFKKMLEKREVKK